MRPLQICRKYHIITEYGDNKIHHPVGAVIDRLRHNGNVNLTGKPFVPIKMCPQSGHTLFIIFYLLSFICS